MKYLCYVEDYIATFTSSFSHYMKFSTFLPDMYIYLHTNFLIVEPVLVQKPYQLCSLPRILNLYNIQSWKIYLIYIKII
jgi:hypothetical protein